MTLEPPRPLVRRLPSAVLRALQQLVLCAAQPFRRDPVTGEAPVVVSLTSHGQRVRRVHHTIESIASGDARPARLVLWVDDPAELEAALRSRQLRRLVRRGLEVLVGEPCGPHAKWWPYVRSDEALDLPLVTADDDVLYTRTWLADLLVAHQRNPHVVHCHRAHRIRFRADGSLAPYMSWLPCRGTAPSHVNFLTGVSGVLYPPALLRALRADGDAFRSVAARADDVWLNARAVAHGFRVAQVAEHPRAYRHVVGSQRVALSRVNGAGGRNDDQIVATYSPELLRVIEAAAEAEAAAEPEAERG